jgi:hypothetical protein
VPKPTTIDFGCADANPSMTGIVWSSWGPSGGVGSGSLHVNNCNPNCAGGATTSAPATVTVSNPTPGVAPVSQDVKAVPSSGGGQTVTGSTPGQWGAG